MIWDCSWNLKKRRKPSNCPCCQLISSSMTGCWKIQKELRCLSTLSLQTSASSVYKITHHCLKQSVQLCRNPIINSFLSLTTADSWLCANKIKLLLWCWSSHLDFCWDCHIGGIGSHQYLPFPLNFNSTDCKAAPWKQTVVAIDYYLKLIFVLPGSQTRNASLEQSRTHLYMWDNYINHTSF